MDGDKNVQTSKASKVHSFAGKLVTKENKEMSVVSVSK